VLLLELFKSFHEALALAANAVSLVLYTLAQAPERVVSASLGVTAP
jgi:hypothetical protein